MKRIKRILFFVTVAFCSLTIAQTDNKGYPNDYLTKEFHTGRRAALRNLMTAKSVAVFFASPERVRSGDVDFFYSQDPNFYYLTGFTEPNAMLLIFKEETTINGKTGNEFIFVQPKNVRQETWTGKIMGASEVSEKLGFKNVFLNEEFEKTEIKFDRLDKIEAIYPVDLPAETSNEKGHLTNLVSQFKTKIANNSARSENLNKWLSALRAIKQPEEITLLQKAIDISCKGHIELMKAVHTGITEYQAQAVMEYYFKEAGSEYVGYPSIIGGGENSCTLHYEKNTKKVFDNELLLADCGAEYHGYSADVTRTMPVNGKFTEEERVIYQLVYDAQQAAIAACKPGVAFGATHKAAVEVIKKGLLKLGLINNERDYQKYFMHGTSHYLGLEVHDVGLYGNLESGNVITVEPGIYIPAGSDCDKKWWNIGIRIEDDVLITPDGHRVMSDTAPKTIEAIEKLISEKSIFKN